MKRKHKTYSRPKRPFDKARLDEEAKIKTDFGLKNKKEIWKADARISSMREKAKKLISADAAEQEKLFTQLKKIGLKIESIADVLALEKQDYLNRRLQTIAAHKFKTTVKTARQWITHKKVLVNGKVVSAPSYVVPIELEDKITLKPKKVKKAVPKEKAPAENDSTEETKSEEVKE